MKKLPLFLLFCLFAPLHLANARELGRIFFTPEQRQLLESGQLRADAENGGSSATIIVNGIVQKRGGKRTVWINGIAQPAGQSNEQSPAATHVVVPGKSRSVQLKVGQKLLLDQPTTQAAPEQGQQ
jgi:hypothetical protein